MNRNSPDQPTNAHTVYIYRGQRALFLSLTQWPQAIVTTTPSRPITSVTRLLVSILIGFILAQISGQAQAAAFDNHASHVNPVDHLNSTTYATRHEFTKSALAHGPTAPYESLHAFTVQGFSCHSTYTVQNTNDSGVGSLRDGVNNFCVGGGTIDFAPALSGQTITLTSGELVPTTDLTLDGLSLPTALTISGNDSSRILNISGNHITISGLTLSNGYAAVEHGGAIQITDSAVVTVTQSTIENSHSSNNGSAIGFAGNTLVIEQSTFIGNSAAWFGGAVANNAGTTYITNRTFSNNMSVSNAGGALFNQSGHCG